MKKHADENRNSGRNEPVTVNFHNEEVPATRALIVHLSVRDDVGTNKHHHRSTEAEIAEITGLALAIELEITDTIPVAIRKIVPATFLVLEKSKKLKVTWQPTMWNWL